MTELVKVEAAPSTAVVPLIGIVVNLESPPEVAKALQAVRSAEKQLTLVKADLERVLAEEAQRQGIKTLHLDGAEVSITGGPDVEYDIEVLQQLLDAGMPQERFDLLVKPRVTYTVDRNVIRQVRGSGNETYVEIVEKATRHIDKVWHAYVK